MNENRRNPDDPDSDDPTPGGPVELTGELVAFLDGELGAEENEAIEARISLDARVRAEADALKKTWDLLDYLPRPEPSPHFTERTISRIDLPKFSPVKTKGAPTPAESDSANGSRFASASSKMVPLVPRSRRKGLFLSALWIVAVLLAGFGGYFGRAQIAGRMNGLEEREKKAEMTADKPLLLNLPKYRYVEKKENLESLDDPELFGDEP